MPVIKKGSSLTLEPISVRIPEAERLTGLSRSELYRRAQRGDIIFRKCGRSVLVEVASLRAAIAAMPIAHK